MDDLVKRLRKPRELFVSRTLTRWSAEREEAADRIEALEARIAKADALVEVAERAVKLSQEYNSFKLYAMEPMWRALAAYRKESDKQKDKQ